ncbi:MgtC/SapB family protein [Sphingomonas sp. AP4-R1]|uniref:MgtC/SapB family protein n=1 Tax=Sphingomonas sp. AP4-R1 TaxID=2735134 RepID=UPI001493B7DF|nr:MgtC/SapB family protein [Sphingomonas sp. AP4-R1]QJU60227.1 MgtC/SapB family protein [Sphingomonas sp. AP4-R1]
MISDTDILLRLTVAALLGSLVGFERERLLWSAGIRTHMLVSVGACLFMIVSAYGFQRSTQLPHVVLDPSRVAAQVVSGVGFLGAGSILLRGGTVRGLTTAASIWAVAALGLAAGGGLFFAAAVSTAIILGILAGLKPFERAYRARVQSCSFSFRCERGAVSIEDLQKILRVRSGQIKRVHVTPADDGGDETFVHLTRVSEADIRSCASRLQEAPGVHSVKAIRKRQIGEGD